MNQNIKKKISLNHNSFKIDSSYIQKKPKKILEKIKNNTLNTNKLFIKSNSARIIPIDNSINLDKITKKVKNKNINQKTKSLLFNITNNIINKSQFRNSMIHRYKSNDLSLRESTDKSNLKDKNKSKRTLRYSLINNK